MARTFKPSIERFPTSVAGVTFANDDGSSRQKIIRKFCKIGDDINLVPEPNNPYDENAVKVCLMNGKQIGYINADFAAVMARKKQRKQGANYAAFVEEIDVIRDGLRKVYYVIITVVEWNDVASEEAAEYLDYRRKTNEAPKKPHIDYAKAGSKLMNLTKQTAQVSVNAIVKTKKMLADAWQAFVNIQ